MSTIIRPNWHASENGSYSFGAFQPATGAAFTSCYGGRTIVNWVDFLEQVEQWLPADAAQVYAILDNLSIPGDRRAALLPGAPPLGVRLPTTVRRLPQPD